jgi:hypothetical protein
MNKTTIEDIPIVDLSIYISSDPVSSYVSSLCKTVADSFHKYGICIIKDPRVEMKDNSDYIDLMEKYFDKVSKRYDEG